MYYFLTTYDLYIYNINYTRQETLRYKVHGIIKTLKNGKETLMAKKKKKKGKKKGKGKKKK